MVDEMVDAVVEELRQLKGGTTVVLYPYRGTRFLSVFYC